MDKDTMIRLINVELGRLRKINTTDAEYLRKAREGFRQKQDYGTLCRAVDKINTTSVEFNKTAFEGYCDEILRRTAQ